MDLKRSCWRWIFHHRTTPYFSYLQTRRCNCYNITPLFLLLIDKVVYLLKHNCPLCLLLTDKVVCPRSKIYFSPSHWKNFMTWSEADVWCKRGHGNLAKITSTEEQLMVDRFRYHTATLY